MTIEITACLEKLGIWDSSQGDYHDSYLNPEDELQWALARIQEDLRSWSCPGAAETAAWLLQKSSVEALILSSVMSRVGTTLDRVRLAQKHAADAIDPFGPNG
jgi:hypothetical protein